MKLNKELMNYARANKLGLIYKSQQKSAVILFTCLILAGVILTVGLLYDMLLH